MRTHTLICINIHVRVLNFEIYNFEIVEIYMRSILFVLRQTSWQ